MTTFMSKFTGPLTSLLTWPEWFDLRETLDRHNDGRWYVYFVGHAVPTAPLVPADFTRFLESLTGLLRKDHEEAYLGIIYVDNSAAPEFIKIYDPNHLGSSCGSSGHRVLPGWVVSRLPPVDLQTTSPLPNNRRRWWQQLFA